MVAREDVKWRLAVGVRVRVRARVRTGPDGAREEERARADTPSLSDRCIFLFVLLE